MSSPDQPSTTHGVFCTSASSQTTAASASTTRTGVHHGCPAEWRPCGPPMASLAAVTSGSSRLGAATPSAPPAPATNVSALPARTLAAPTPAAATTRHYPPVPPLPPDRPVDVAVGEALRVGVTVGDGFCVGVGDGGGVSVGLGVGGGVGVGVGGGLGVRVGVRGGVWRGGGVDRVGVGLGGGGAVVAGAGAGAGLGASCPSAVCSRFAGAGKGITSAPAIARDMIARQVSAGCCPPKNVSRKPSSGSLPLPRTYITAVASWGV